MLKGRYETTADSKGRTSLPARFREAFQDRKQKGRLVITTPMEPCLRIYPMNEWNEFEKKLAALPSFDPKLVSIKRVFVAGAVECQVDSHGRILIPQVLRQYAGIKKDVVWCGMVSYLELWNVGRWKSILDQARRETQKYSVDLAELGL